MTDKEQNQPLSELLGYLKNSRGFDFTGYKYASLTRRIEKRMQTGEAGGAHLIYQALQMLQRPSFNKVVFTL